MTKNFGPAVSGYLIPDGMAFETTVFQAGKPVLDKELNLTQDLDSGYALGLSRSIAPSGWLTDIHTNTSDPIDSVFVPSPTANVLLLANNLTALVNGWPVPVAYTLSAAGNQLTLPVGPSGNGSKRTDLVILEVWRCLLAPSNGFGKSPTARIWRNGNVKIDPSLDATLNYVDQMLDVTVGAETTKRVQIQYRLRVISGVDLFAHPYGIDDPLVVANSVPATPSTPDGVATSFNYINQSSVGDPGLWVAGNGVPTNALGTVDGLMYAIPLGAIFRRNTTPFSKNSNHNGGAVNPGPSDRPDGLLSDIFAAQDFADLRQATSLKGWNYQEVAEKNFGLLLDNDLKTEWTTTPIGGGVSGHTVLWADEIGTLPGDGVITGDTAGAEFRGQFDCTRRFFTDRANYEVMTFKITPGDPNISTSTWQSGTRITITPSLISQWPFPATIGFLSRAPSGTRILDVVRARIEGSTSGHTSVDVGFSSLGLTAEVPVPITNIQGLCSYPAGNIVITIGNPPVAATTEPMYIDLLVAYPPGQGLSKTPSGDYGANSFVINNPSALSSAAPVSFASMGYQVLDYPHRQVQLQYLTSQQTFLTISDSTTATTMLTLPERANSLVQVKVNSVVRGAALSGNSGRIVQLSSDANPGDVIEVDYIAVRPVPQSTVSLTPGVQFTIYYQAQAPQTIRGDVLGTNLSLIPRWISPSLYVITTGSGSQGEGYPYPEAYVQTGGVIQAVGTFGGEYQLNGSEVVYVADFNASTGFLKLPALIPYVPDPESVSFSRGLLDADIEGRTYFSTFPVGYQPNAFSSPLSDARVHKVVLPTLMETASDSSLGKKGTLLLVNFVRWAQSDEENDIKVLDPSVNTTTVSVFRLSGNLLNRRS